MTHIRKTNMVDDQVFPAACGMFIRWVIILFLVPLGFLKPPSRGKNRTTLQNHPNLVSKPISKPVSKVVSKPVSKPGSKLVPISCYI